MDATAVVAWTGLGLGATALALVWRWRPRDVRPRVAVSLASARHARAGLDSTIRAVLEVRNDGGAEARLLGAEVEVAALTNGAVGLRTTRRTASVPLAVLVPPRTRTRVPVSVAFEEALLPDGKVEVRVRLAHDGGAAETVGTSVN